MWKEHLAGKIGLGVVPIKDNDMVRFAAIDIDDYDYNIEHCLNMIEPFPIIPCRTKSGGYHLYMFFKEEIAAALAQRRLRDLAAYIGLGSQVEVFPKQTKLLKDRGDFGSWLNMPYFNADDITDRYAIDKKGNELTATAFLDLAFQSRITKSRLSSLKFLGDEKNDVGINDGPPCLELLMSEPIGEGGRNILLFNIGIYLRAAQNETWEEELYRINEERFDPPLDKAEVEQTVKSLERHEAYHYQCREEPLRSHCNRARCVLRKHGVGVANETNIDLSQGSLTRVNTTPPLWFIDGLSQDGTTVRISLEHEQILSYAQFRSRWLEETNCLPPVNSQKELTTLLNNLLPQLEIIDIDSDDSPIGQFELLLEEFCTRARAEQLSDIRYGQVFSDPDEKRTYFRFEDFLKFIQQAKFEAMTKPQIITRLRQHYGMQTIRKRFDARHISMKVIDRYYIFDSPEEIKLENLEEF